MFNSHDMIELSYGDIVMMTHKSALADALESVSKYDAGQLARIKESVDIALRANLTKLANPDTLVKSDADDFFGDLLLWEALKGMSS